MEVNRLKKLLIVALSGLVLAGSGYWLGYSAGSNQSPSTTAFTPVEGQSYQIAYYVRPASRHNTDLGFTLVDEDFRIVHWIPGDRLAQTQDASVKPGHALFTHYGIKLNRPTLLR